jgi:flagellar protein FlgJ
MNAYPSRTDALSATTTGSVSDARSLAALRNAAAKDPKSAIRETAKQFESMFMQQLLKSMRDAQAAMGGDPLDNEGSKLGTELLDGEYAKKLSGAPGGLADVIARQLERQMGALGSEPLGGNRAGTAPLPGSAAGAAGAALSPATGAGRQADFVRLHTQAARAAEAQSGIPAQFMVAQAAHESGWGRREIRNLDGSSSFNVFGIKAGASWSGPVARVSTTEYVDGVARKTSAAFRSYGSYEEAFQDYARLMKESPRYSGVVASASSGSASGFAQGLQRAGYATDPAYAEKLTRVINTTLRLQRVTPT